MPSAHIHHNFSFKFNKRPKSIDPVHTFDQNLSLYHYKARPQPLASIRLPPQPLNNHDLLNTTLQSQAPAKSTKQKITSRSPQFRPNPCTITTHNHHANPTSTRTLDTQDTTLYNCFLRTSHQRQTLNFT